MEKRIKDYEDYGVTDDGRIISYKYKQPREMKTWKHKKTGYVYANLSKGGIMKHFPLHRLVAEAFIPNPKNYPEVDHLNGQRDKNEMSNLEWVTHKENILRSFENAGPVRNHHNCKLIQISTGLEIEMFESITAAARFASEEFGCSESSIVKHKKSKDYKVERCND